MQNAYVFLFVLNARVRSMVSRGVTWAKEILTKAFRPLRIIPGLVGDFLRSREELVART